MGLPQLPAAEGIRRRTKPDLETQVEKVTVPTTLASVTAALSEYTKQTRIDLINDPLAVVIDKTGDSLDSTLDILQDGVPRELGAANSTLTNVLRSIIRECRALSTSIGVSPWRVYVSLSAQLTSNAFLLGTIPCKGTLFCNRRSPPCAYFHCYLQPTLDV